MENNEIATPLRERVFQACQDIEDNGQKVTRESVKAITGGSYRDLSRYIREWRDSRKLVVQTTQSEVITQTENNVQTLENDLLDPHADIAEIIHEGAEVAAELILTKQSVVSYFLQNPHQLPDNLKQKIKDNSNVIRSGREQHYKERYNSESLTKRALDQIKKK